MTLDTLTNDLIQTLEKFDKLGLNEKARDYWTKSYVSARVIRGTLNVHCIDSFAYDVANKRLEHYYNIIKDYKRD